MIRVRGLATRRGDEGSGNPGCGPPSPHPRGTGTGTSHAAHDSPEDQATGQEVTVKLTDGTHGAARAARRPVIALFVLIALAVAASLAPAAPRRAARGFPARMPGDIPVIAALGSHADACDGCHTAHAEGATPQPGLLMAPNDNQLCATCHDGQWTSKSFPGLAHYTGSAHGANPNVVWPGPDPPARMATDAGMCRNCHDPHGYNDLTGLIPRLTLQREEKLCLACHDGEGRRCRTTPPRALALAGTRACRVHARRARGAAAGRRRPGLRTASTWRGRRGGRRTRRRPYGRRCRWHH